MFKLIPTIKQNRLFSFAIMSGFILRVLPILHGLPLHIDVDEPTLVTRTLALSHTPLIKIFDWPQLYFYINLPFFAVGYVLKPFLTIPWELSENGYFFLIGRCVSILFGTATIYMIYRITKQLFHNEKTAVIASLFIAFLPIHVMESSYAKLDIALTFFASLVVLSIVKNLEGITLRKVVVSGAIIGFAMSIKYNAFLLFFPLTLLVLTSYTSFTDLMRHYIRVLYLPVAGFAALVAFFMGTPAALVYFSTFWSKQPRVGLLWQFSNVGNVGTEKYLESVSETFLQMFRNDLGMTLWVVFLLLILLYLFFNLRNRVYTIFILPVIVISLYISKFERSPSHYFLFLIPLYIPVLADFTGRAVLRIRKTLPSLTRIRFYKLAVCVVLLPSIYVSVYTSLINMRKDTRVLAYRWFTENITANQYPVYVYGEPLEPIVFQQKKSERLKRVDTDYIKELPAILIIGTDGVTESKLKDTDYEPREISGSSGKVLRNAKLLYSAENTFRTGPPVLIYRIDSFTPPYGN